jgi:chromosome segregation ATPase
LVEKAQSEQTRQILENEITELYDAIARKERELTQRFEAVSAVELALHGKIQALQQELARCQSEFADRDLEIEKVRADAESASQRFAEEQRQHFEAEVNLLRSTLAERENAFGEAENAQQSLLERLHGEITELRAQLEHERHEAALRSRQLDGTQADLAAVREQQAALEQAKQEAEENWQRAGYIQTELQARLKAKTAELADSQTNLGALRQEFGDKINELQLELAQKQLLADSRASEIADLKDRLNQLTAQLAGAEAASRQSSDRQRESDENLLARQQEIAALEENYQARLRNLESELAEAWNKADSATSETQQWAERAGRMDAELRARSDNLAAAGSESAALQARLDELASQHASSQAQAHALEQARAQLDSQLAALRQELEQKNSELIQQRELALSEKNALQEFSSRLSEQGELAARYRQEIESAQDEAAALNQRISALELAAAQAERSASDRIEQITQESAAKIETLNAALNAALAEKSAVLENSRLDLANLEQSLRQEIQQSNWALAQQQAAAEALGAAHRDQLQKLEAKLREQQSGSVERNSELERSNDQVRALTRRIEELETGLRHAEITALSRADQMRQESAAQIDALDAALKQKSAELEQRNQAQVGLDQALRQEIDRLQNEAAERNRILQTRNDELVQAQSELERIRERFHELESAAVQARTLSAGEVESLRAEFQGQLALLHAELGKKNSALAEQQASVSGLEQKYRDEITALRQQLSEHATSRRQAAREMDISATQLERLAQLESMLHDPATGMAQAEDELSQRRWRSRFVAKRRWKNL